MTSELPWNMTLVKRNYLPQWIVIIGLAHQHKLRYFFISNVWMSLYRTKWKLNLYQCWQLECVSNSMEMGQWRAVKDKPTCNILMGRHPNIMFYRTKYIYPDLNMGAVHMDFFQFLHYHLNGPYLIWEISPCGQPWWSLRTKYTLTWIFFNSFIIWEISPCFNSFVIIYLVNLTLSSTLVATAL